LGRSSGALPNRRRGSPHTNPGRYGRRKVMPELKGSDGGNRFSESKFAGGSGRAKNITCIEGRQGQI